MEEKYEDIFAISQSSIKDFKKMPPIEWKKVWIDKQVKAKKSVSLDSGSLVNDLLFYPDKVESKYLICEIEKPSDAISFIIDKIWAEQEYSHLISLKELDDWIIFYAKVTPMKDKDGKIKLGYGQSWEDNTLITKVLREGNDYFEFLKTTNGKCIIPSMDYMSALIMAEAMKKNEIVKPYLDPKQNLFEFDIITDDDFPEKLKGRLDILHFDDEKKEIRIVDFKTADSAYYFFMNVIKFDYLEQVAFYDNLLRYWRLLDKNSKYLEYDILPPMNIVIDRNYNTPYFYEYNFKDISAAWNGYFKYGKWQKGIREWIKEIQWHILNDAWDYPMEHYLYGKISLNLINHG